MDVNFELYKVFYYVARNLSFSEASNTLFISQSAVSQTIKSLEKKLNCKLFVRNTKQVRLTQEGEILFKHIEQAFNLIKGGERSIEDVHSLKQGEIRIGTSDTICKHVLLPSINLFHSQYPNIKIKITNRTSPRCIELLQKGSVDVAVVNIPEKMQEKNLNINKVQTIQDVLLAGRNYSFLKDIPINLKDLEKYPILMLEKHSTTRAFLDNHLSKQGINLVPEIELGSIDLLIEMAKIGMGISFVVKEYVTHELGDKEVFILNLTENIPTRSIGVVTNSSIPLPLAAQKFIELV